MNYSRKEFRRLKMLPAHVGALLARERAKLRKELAGVESKLLSPHRRRFESELLRDADDLRSRIGALYEFGMEFRKMNRRMIFKSRYGE